MTHMEVYRNIKVFLSQTIVTIAIYDKSDFLHGKMIRSTGIFLPRISSEYDGRT